MAQKRPSTRPVSSTRRREKVRGPAKDPVQRIYEETEAGGSTMNLALSKFAETSEEHDPSKPEHYIVAGEPHPTTGERYPTVHARMPGHMLSSTQWEAMSPETKAMKPFSMPMISERLAKLRGDREAAGRWERQSGEAAALGTWRVPREGEEGEQHPRYGQVDLDVSASMKKKHASVNVAHRRGEEAVFATNPMRDIPTVIGHLLGMAYHPLDLDIKRMNEGAIAKGKK